MGKAVLFLTQSLDALHAYAAMKAPALEVPAAPATTSENPPTP